jgi:hypothetical protein
LHLQQPTLLAEVVMAAVVVVVAAVAVVAARGCLSNQSEHALQTLGPLSRLDLVFSRSA